MEYLELDLLIVYLPHFTQRKLRESTENSLEKAF